MRVSVVPVGAPATGGGTILPAMSNPLLAGGGIAVMALGALTMAMACRRRRLKAQ